MVEWVQVRLLMWLRVLLMFMSQDYTSLRSILKGGQQLERLGAELRS